jgi:hypothetical protein
LADTPAPVHTLRHSNGDTLGCNEEWRQNGGGLFGAVTQRAGLSSAARQKAGIRTQLS